MKRRIVLLGPPASGKGTLTELGIFARVDANRSFELVFKDAGELITG